MALEPFRKAPKMKELLIRHADVIVPMNALKWASLRYVKRRFDFSGADEIIEFAERHGKAIHGHTLLWYGFNPKWLDRVRSERDLERFLNEHIETVMGRYAGRIASWDVVNEVVAHDPLNGGAWRRGVWYDVMGPRHVEVAFRAAALVDPSADLYINDYDLEDASPRTKARQDALLKIVRRLQDKNIPIHGVGLQAHLYAERKIGKDNLFIFIEQLKRLGLKVAVTELDVIDWKLPRDPQVRDRAVEATAREFLETLTASVTPSILTTWGLNDRYSWIRDTFKRNDRGRARPLPFDRDWNPKPFFDLIQQTTN